MYYCFGLSFLWFLCWVASACNGDESGKNLATVMGGIFLVGAYIAAEIRKGRKQ